MRVLATSMGVVIAPAIAPMGGGGMGIIDVVMNTMGVGAYACWVCKRSSSYLAIALMGDGHHGYYMGISYGNEYYGCGNSYVYQKTNYFPKHPRPLAHKPRP